MAEAVSVKSWYSYMGQYIHVIYMYLPDFQVNFGQDIAFYKYRVLSIY